MLAVASLIPGIDTFADMAAFGVDALRGDLATAVLDLVGAIPIVGEAADTARLARLGLDAADAAVDMARAVDKAGDVAKAVDKTTENVGELTEAVETVKDTTDFTKIIGELPKNPNDLIEFGWEDVTDPRSLKNNPKLRHYKKNGVEVKFEKATPGASGFRGIDHYHIRNPKATGNHDYYLDKFGNPVSRKSKQSHIVIQQRGDIG